jgi:pilus assembly protein Flp/PilA
MQKGGPEMKGVRDMYYGLMARFFNAVSNKKGQTLVEYALLLVLIAIVVIIMVKGTGKTVNNVFSNINSSLANP